ncbi:hypothetical protein NLB65_01500 [Candidatus Aminicenantes bacterium AC-335-B20]|jgi:hypothetical protein|nr:hypothetical protein [SCandidatus Aminicenantes bacterium Aminicenantia_JdfR_composite]MCP2599116.1 hypothetical protein [Candidatus Aminicenantes bacterium AC-335-B20]
MERSFKKPYLSAIFLLLITSLLYSQEIDILKIKGKIKPSVLLRGQEGKVILKLEVPNGVYINFFPSIVIEFKPCKELIFSKNFFTSSDLELESFEKNGNKYLNLKKSIEIPFKVSMNAKRGNHKLKGEIKYFACSSSEGWCLKSSKKFIIPFSTLKTIYRGKSK